MKLCLKDEVGSAWRGSAGRAGGARRGGLQPAGGSRRRFYATCHPGLEPALAAELRSPPLAASGVVAVQPGRAGVSFEADAPESLYSSLLWLRGAVVRCPAPPLPRPVPRPPPAAPRAPAPPHPARPSSALQTPRKVFAFFRAAILVEPRGPAADGHENIQGGRLPILVQADARALEAVDRHRSGRAALLLKSI